MVAHWIAAFQRGSGPYSTQYTLKYCKLKNAKPEFELLLPAD